MKNLLFLSLIFVCAINFTACEKSSDQNSTETDNLLVGKWAVIKTIDQREIGDEILEQEWNFEIEDAVILVFYKDFRFSATEKEGEVSQGVYLVQDNILTLTVELENDEDYVETHSFTATENEIIMTEVEQDGSITTTTISTLTRLE